MNFDPTQPAVWTTQGNMNADRLQYATKWEICPGEWTKFIETYTLDGEVVRESAHVLSHKGVDMSGQQAAF